MSVLGFALGQSYATQLALLRLCLVPGQRTRMAKAIAVLVNIVASP